MYEGHWLRKAIEWSEKRPIKLEYIGERKLKMVRMPFGMYAGMDLMDIPLEYLKWAEENLKLRNPLHNDIKFEIQRRTGDRPGQGKVIKEGKVRTS